LTDTDSSWAKSEGHDGAGAGQQKPTDRWWAWLASALVGATSGTAVNNYSETGIRGLLIVASVAGVLVVTRKLRTFPGTRLFRYSLALLLALAASLSVAAAFAGGRGWILLVLAGVCTLGAMLLATDPSAAIALFASTATIAGGSACVNIGWRSLETSTPSAVCWLIIGAAALTRGLGRLSGNRRIITITSPAIPAAMVACGIIFLSVDRVLLGLVFLGFGISWLTTPITIRRQAEQNRQMQHLRREVRRLQEVHRGDLVTLQLEMMALYRNTKLGGRIPVAVDVGANIVLFIMVTSSTVALVWLAIRDRQPAVVAGAFFVAILNIGEILVISRRTSITTVNSLSNAGAYLAFGVIAVVSSQRLLGVALLALGLSLIGALIVPNTAPLRARVSKVVEHLMART
jgi:hypothetical protein